MTYAELAPIYNRIGMADFATEITPQLLQYAQQNDWLGRRVLDLGCGTAASMMFFTGVGFHATGVDRSTAMLDVARELMQAENRSAQFIEMDLRDLSLSEQTDMVLALDVLNELDSLRDLENVFTAVKALMPPDKLFIFDLHTMRGLANDAPQRDHLLYNETDLAVFTHSDYEYERQISRLTYHIFKQTSPEQWHRAETRRVLRAYPVQVVANLLRRRGFEIMAVLDTRLKPVDPAAPAVPRVVVMARS